MDLMTKMLQEKLRDKTFVSMVTNEAPKKARKPRKQTRLPADYPDDIVSAVVPDDTTSLPWCLSCHVTLRSNTRHWRLAEKRSRTWWCSTCMSQHCGYPILGKQPARKKKERVK